MKEPKYKVGDSVEFLGIGISITQVSNFGNANHYGFIADQDDENGRVLNGWIPVSILDEHGTAIACYATSYRPETNYEQHCAACGWLRHQHVSKREFCPVL
jgi:hypothetical protein